jgi:hypothetical protein
MNRRPLPLLDSSVPDFISPKSGRAPSFPKAPFISMAISRILSVAEATGMIIYLDPLA